MADFTLVIGNKNYSSWSLRGWLMAKAAGIDFEEVVVPLDLPETQPTIRKHSRSGRVPVLLHRGLAVWETLAIGDRNGGGSPLMAHFLKRFAAFEFRPIPPFGELEPAPQPGPSRLWFRMAAPAPADPAMRSAMLAYLSDFGLLTTAVLPHGIPLFSGKLQVASLDHALWLHELPDLDHWHLFTMESPWAGGGRGLTRGTFHSATGRHVASVSQEGLIRPATHAPSPRTAH